MAIDLGLLGDAVVLQFEVKILRAEGLLEPVNRLARLGQLVLQDGLGNLAGQAAGKRDEAVLVRGEQFLVDARLVIIALQMRGGGELDEVFVAGFVLREQHEMVVNIAPAAVGFLFVTAAGRDIHLAADDGLDALVRGRPGKNQSRRKARRGR